MLGEYLMGPLKRYLTQSLESSLSKYISNINIETLGVGGDIILRDLELRLDVLQRSLKIPLTFEFSRGFIKELRIQIHWTKLFSQPIHIKVSTIEIILTARSELQFRRLQLAYQRKNSASSGSSLSDGESVQSALSPVGGGSAAPAAGEGPGAAAAGLDAGAAQTPGGHIEPPPEEPTSGGWLKDAIRKIVANATIEVSDLVLKYEHANVVLSASFRSLSIFSADPAEGWRMRFQEPEGRNKSVAKACEFKDLTINLERTGAREADSSGRSASPSIRPGRRRTSSSGSGGSFGTTSKRSSLRARALTVELPVLRRASVNVRARISIDPYAARAGLASAGPDGAVSERPEAPRLLGASEAEPGTEGGLVHSTMSLIKRSTSETLLANAANSGRGRGGRAGAGASDAAGEPLAANVDPYYGTRCLLPLLCNRDTESWRASRTSLGSGDDPLDWAIVSVADVHIHNLDFSVSEEQFIMLGKLMVLPDDVEASEESETDDSEAEGAAAAESCPPPNILYPAKTERLRNGPSPPPVPSPQAPTLQRAEAAPRVEDAGGSWRSWAWGVVVGENDEALDSLESEMVLDAFESAKQAAIKRQEAAQAAIKRKRFLSVCGMRIDKVSLTFLLHRSGSEAGLPEAEVAASAASVPGGAATQRDGTGDPELVAVPVANMGVVRVQMDAPKVLTPRPSSAIGSSLVELARFRVQGITLEARLVDDPSPGKVNSFVEVYADVDVTRFSRYEEAQGLHHDIFLWGATKRDHSPAVATILDPMPHPWFCWSFFRADNPMEACEQHVQKDCCLGTSVYRRTDKAIRVRAFAPMRKPEAPDAAPEPTTGPDVVATQLDAALGPISSRVDHLLIKGVSEFLGLAKAKPQAFSTRPELPKLKQGTAGAALKDLAAEYAHRTRKPRRALAVRPIEALCTLPSVRVSLSARKPLEPPTAHSLNLGTEIKDVVLRFASNMRPEGSEAPAASALNADLLPQIRRVKASSDDARARPSPDRAVKSVSLTVKNVSTFLSVRDSKLQHAVSSGARHPPHEQQGHQVDFLRADGIAASARASKNTAGGKEVNAGAQFALDRLVVRASKANLVRAAEVVCFVLQPLASAGSGAAPAGSPQDDGPSMGEHGGDALRMELFGLGANLLWDVLDQQLVCADLVLQSLEGALEGGGGGDGGGGDTAASAARKVVSLHAGPQDPAARLRVFAQGAPVRVLSSVTMSGALGPQRASTIGMALRLCPLVLDLGAAAAVGEFQEAVKVRIFDLLATHLNVHRASPAPPCREPSEDRLPRLVDARAEPAPLLVASKTQALNAYLTDHFSTTCAVVDIDAAPARVLLTAALSLEVPGLLATSRQESGQEVDWKFSGANVGFRVRGGQRRFFVGRGGLEVRGSLALQATLLKSTGQLLIQAKTAMQIAELDLSFGQAGILEACAALALASSQRRRSEQRRHEHRQPTDGASEPSTARSRKRRHLAPVLVDLRGSVSFDAIKVALELPVPRRDDHELSGSWLELPEALVVETRQCVLDAEVDHASRSSQFGLQMGDFQVAERLASPSPPCVQPPAGLVSVLCQASPALVIVASCDGVSRAALATALGLSRAWLAAPQVLCAALEPSAFGLSAASKAALVSPVASFRQGADPLVVNVTPSSGAQPPAAHIRLRAFDLVLCPGLLTGLTALSLAMAAVGPTSQRASRRSTRASPGQGKAHIQAQIPQLRLSMDQIRVVVPVAKRLPSTPAADPVRALVLGLAKVSCEDSRHLHVGDITMNTALFRVGPPPKSAPPGHAWIADNGGSSSFARAWYGAELMAAHDSEPLLRVGAFLAVSETESASTRTKVALSLRHVKATPATAQCALASQVGAVLSRATQAGFVTVCTGWHAAVPTSGPYFAAAVARRVAALSAQPLHPPARPALPLDIDMSIDEVEIGARDASGHLLARTRILGCRLVHEAEPVAGSLTIEEVSCAVGDESLLLMEPVEDTAVALVKWNRASGAHTTSVSVEFAKALNIRVSGAAVSGLRAALRDSPAPASASLREPARLASVVDGLAAFRRAVAGAVREAMDDILFEESDSGLPVLVSTKVIVPGIQVVVDAAPGVPKMIVAAEQVFVQHALRERGRSEFDLVAVGAEVQREAREGELRRSTILNPFDVRLAGLDLGSSAQHKTLNVEVSDLSVAVSKEHLAVLEACSRALNGPRPTKSMAKKKENGGGAASKRRAEAGACTKGLQEEEAEAEARMVQLNDFDSLKRIYDVGASEQEEPVSPGPGQVVFRAYGTAGEVVAQQGLWDVQPGSQRHSREHDSSDVGRQQFAKARPPSLSEARRWVTMRWKYFEPRIVELLQLVQLVPVPSQVGLAAIDPTSLRRNVIDCQLCYWDRIHRVFVVVQSFEVPLESNFAALQAQTATVDDFADAFSNLVDLSMSEDKADTPASTGNCAHSGEAEAAALRFPVRLGLRGRVEPTREWMLRWKAAPNDDGARKDDRLAVCAALSRSLAVGSVARRAFWHTAAINVEVQRFRLAVLHSALAWSESASSSIALQDDCRDEEELFILRARGLSSSVQQGRGKLRTVAEAAVVDLFVQDFGYLTVTPLMRISPIRLTCCSSFGAVPARDAISVECKTLKLNLSRKTILPFHYGVHAFARDMQSVNMRAQELLGTGSASMPSRDGAGRGGTELVGPRSEDHSLQYLLVNSTGRPLWFGQYGTAEVEQLEPGDTRPYSWRVSRPYLKPTIKDRLLLFRQMLGDDGYQSAMDDAGSEARRQVEVELSRRERACKAFEPLMRFALEAPGRSDSPGTWSRPVSVDHLGVHKRQLVLSGVHKDEKSAFFGAEPSSYLWISAQRGENGLQTIVRLLPSHMLVSHLPIPLHVRVPFTNTEAIMPACAAAHVRARARAKPSGWTEPRPPERAPIARARSGSESSAKGEGATQRESVGFIDERDFDYSSMGAGMLGIMCPDISLTPQIGQGVYTKAGDVAVQLRASLAADWGAPITLDLQLMESGPQLIQVPDRAGKEPLWLWIHVKQTMIRSRKGGLKRAWHAVELWPTAYVVNDSPRPMRCLIRPQTRLEQLQYALRARDESLSDGKWPALEPERADRPAQAEAPEADEKGQTSAGQPQTGIVARFLREEGAAPARPAGTDWRVEPGQALVLYVDPRADQVVCFAHCEAESSGDGDGDADHASPAPAWSGPPLQLHGWIFQRALAHYMATLHQPGEEAVLAQRLVKLGSGVNSLAKDGERDAMVAEVRALEGHASLLMRLQAPIVIRNDTDRELVLLLTCATAGAGAGEAGSQVGATEAMGSNRFIRVPARDELGVGLEREMVPGLRVALGRNTDTPTGTGGVAKDAIWSSLVSLDAPDEHLVAIPLSEGKELAGWVAQFLCQVVFDATLDATEIRFRNRIVVHNETDYDLVLTAEAPFVQTAGDSPARLGASSLARRAAATPLSFFTSSPLRDDERDEPASLSPPAGNADADAAVYSADQPLDGDDPAAAAKGPLGQRSFSDWIMNRAASRATAGGIPRSGAGRDGPGAHGGKGKAAQAPDFRLLSTSFRVRLASGSLAWSELLVVPSLEADEPWQQYALIATSTSHFECFLLHGREVDGVVHVSVAKELQPDALLRNDTGQTLCFALNKKMGWQLARNATASSTFGFVLPHGATLAVKWALLTRRDDPAFEVLWQSDVDEGDSESVEGGSPPGADTSARPRASSAASRVPSEDSNTAFARRVSEDLVRAGLAPPRTLCIHVGKLPGTGAPESRLTRKGSKAGPVFRVAVLDDAELPADCMVAPLETLRPVFSTIQWDADQTAACELRATRGRASSGGLQATISADAGRREEEGEQGEDEGSGPLPPLRRRLASAGNEPVEAPSGPSVKVIMERDTCAMALHFVAGDTAELTPSREREEKLRSLDALVCVSDFQVSLFDEFLETIHICLRGVEMSFCTAVLRRPAVSADVCGVWERGSATARLQLVQIDSYVPESETPVVLYFLVDEDDLEQDQPLECARFNDPEGAASDPRFESARASRDRFLLAASWVQSVGASRAKLPPQFGPVEMRLGAMAVTAEDALLKRLAETLTPVAATLVAQQRLVRSWRKPHKAPGSLASATRATAVAVEGRDGRVGDLAPLAATRSSGRGFVEADVPAELRRVDQRIFVRRLRISELHIVSTLRTSTLPMFVGIDRTPFRFSAVEVVDVFERPGEVRRELLANYIADAILGSPALLGSLEILGNPAGFVRSIGAGVYDLFSMPLKAVLHGYGPGGILRGVARGWTSLLVRFSEGALTSVSGFSSSVARNLDKLSMDAAYAAQREKLRRRRTQSSSSSSSATGSAVISIKRSIAEDELLDDLGEVEDLTGFAAAERLADGTERFSHSSLSEFAARRAGVGRNRFGAAKGLARGMVGFSQGVVGGATGILTRPLESAAQGGWGLQSVLKGVGMGLVGVVTKPMGGAADFVAQTSGGIMQEVGIGPASGPPILRKRKALQSMAHHALRLNWKVFAGRDEYLRHDRVLLHATLLVDVVVSARGLSFLSVYQGRGPCDVSHLLSFRWSHLLDVSESFSRDTLLVLEVPFDASHARRLGLPRGASRAEPPPTEQLPLHFASKHDRREFAKVVLFWFRQQQQQQQLLLQLPDTPMATC